MRLRPRSGRPLSASVRTTAPSTSAYTAPPRRQVCTRGASMFITPESDSIDAVEAQPVYGPTYEYPPGYSLFKVKRAKNAVVDDDATLADIMEKEFLTSHKTGAHHISIYTSDLSKSIDFYTKGLGLKMSPWRPSNLPYSGAWFNVPAVGHGDNVMIHLIGLPNPLDFSQCHDESCIIHFSIAIQQGTLKEFQARMDAQGFQYYKSVNDREAAIFCDPNGYRMEVIELPERSHAKAKRAH